MIVCFDTSGINHLFDDPRREELVARLLAENEVRITALNLIEIGKTNNSDRREQLRGFTKDLALEVRPLELPNILIREMCQAFQDGRHDITITVSGESEGFWIAMSEVNSLGPEEREELRRWANTLESDSTDMARRFKPIVDAIFQNNPAARPKTAIRLLRGYMKSWQLQYEFVAKVYKRETGRVLPLSRLDIFLEADPTVWKIFLAGYAISIFYGAIYQPASRSKNRVGIVDLWSGVYLPFCDVFVTNDRKNGGQFESLRIQNAFNSSRPRTRVLRWQEFRELVLDDRLHPLAP